MFHWAVDAQIAPSRQRELGLLDAAFGSRLAGAVTLHMNDVGIIEQ